MHENGSQRHKEEERDILVEGAFTCDGTVYVALLDISSEERSAGWSWEVRGYMGIEAKRIERVNDVRASQKRRSRSTVEQSVNMQRDRTGSWIEKHLFSGIVRLSRSRETAVDRWS